MQLLDTLKAYAKAIAGLIMPGAATIVAAVQEQSPGHGSITQGEWIGIALAIIGGGVVVAVAPANVAPVNDSDLDDEPARGDA